MKINFLRSLYLIPIIVACTTAHAQKTSPSLTIAGKELTLQLHTKCPQPRPSRKELAKYLAQYDPRQEEDLSVYDGDRAFDIKEIQDSLIQDGFRYPNGQESVITWMDFDGDGICDFTASAGIGGMKPIDRMFLFRGLPNGKFKLVDAYLNYMNNDILVVPYISINVSGEKLPVILKDVTINQWQGGHKKFAQCEEPSVNAKRKKHLGQENKKTQTLINELCPHWWDIYKWAKSQLPYENRISHSYIDFDK